MAFTPQARKATKHQVKLKIGIQGPSGSGKTMGALALAKGFVPNGKILLVDTEHESASLYADKFDFDTIPLPPPFLSSSYEACVDYAVNNGYDVLIFDTITHQWDGDGGILRRKEAVDERGGNSFTNWKPFTEEHNRFKEKLIQAPIHIIATMRSKTEYIMEQNDKGKSMPKKVGTAPIQRDGMEYEFSIVFDVQMDHRGKASKNRTGLFGTKLVDLCDPKTSEELREWMSTGDIAPVIAPAPVSAPQSVHASEIKSSAGGAKTVTQPQQARLFAIAKKVNASPDDIKAVLKHFGYEHSKDITMADYEKMCGLFPSGEWEQYVGEAHAANPTVITDADLPPAFITETKPALLEEEPF